MYGFSAYYWDVAELGEADRRAVRALDEASPALPSAGYATHDEAGLVRAFRTLLHSDDVRARGVALDQFTYAGGQHRWTSQDPLGRLAAEVLAEARAMLAVSHDPSVPLRDQPLVTSAWNSALGALSRVDAGIGADLARIVEVLDLAYAAAAGGDEVLDVFASWALEAALTDSDEATCARVGRWLAGVFGDVRLPRDIRTGAVGPFRDDRLAGRLGQQAALVDLLRDGDLRLSIEAAWTLVGRPGCVDAVRAAVAGWPPDAPYPASEVLDELAS